MLDEALEDDEESLHVHGGMRLTAITSCVEIPPSTVRSKEAGTPASARVGRGNRRDWLQSVLVIVFYSVVHSGMNSARRSLFRPRLHGQRWRVEARHLT